MKIHAEILGVETTGDTLVVTTQASEVASAHWRPMEKLTFRVSDIARNRKALHVGRLLTITVEPK